MGCEYLFWDVDPRNLDIQDDRALIIPRALMATTAETFSKDILPLEKLYSKVQIVKELCLASLLNTIRELQSFESFNGSESANLHVN